MTADEDAVFGMVVTDLDLIPHGDAGIAVLVEKDLVLTTCGDVVYCLATLAVETCAPDSDRSKGA